MKIGLKMNVGKTNAMGNSFAGNNPENDRTI